MTLSILRNQLYKIDYSRHYMSLYYYFIRIDNFVKFLTLGIK